MTARHLLERLALVVCLATSTIASTGCAADTDLSEEGEYIPDEADGEPVGTSGDAITRSDFETPNLSASQRTATLAKYDHIDPNKRIPREHLEDALVFFDVNKEHLDNQKYIVVVDFSRHSRERRFFLVDMNEGDVASYVTAHGSGSDPDNDGMADRFLNVKDSNASSLGFYVTAEIYEGKWGRSLRLDGVSDTNSQVRVRDVVLHGAEYVRDGRAKQGRSWGCFVLPLDQKDSVITKIAGGALIYAAK